MTNKTFSKDLGMGCIDRHWKSARQVSNNAWHTEHEVLHSQQVHQYTCPGISARHSLHCCELIFVSLAVRDEKNHEIIRWTEKKVSNLQPKFRQTSWAKRLNAFGRPPGNFFEIWRMKNSVTKSHLLAYWHDAMSTFSTALCTFTYAINSVMKIISNEFYPSFAEILHLWLVY